MGCRSQTTCEQLKMTEESWGKVKKTNPESQDSASDPIYLGLLIFQKFVF